MEGVRFEVSREEIHKMLFIVEPYFDDLVQISEDIITNNFDVDKYTNTLYKLDKTGVTVK